MTRSALPHPPPDSSRRTTTRAQLPCTEAPTNGLCSRRRGAPGRDVVCNCLSAARTWLVTSVEVLCRAVSKEPAIAALRARKAESVTSSLDLIACRRCPRLPIRVVCRRTIPSTCAISPARNRYLLNYIAYLRRRLRKREPVPDQISAVGLARHVQLHL